MVMMNVFRRKRRRAGKRQIDRVYTGRFRLPGDVLPVTVALGVTDKRVAMDKLRDLVSQEERRRAGLLLPVAQVDAASVSLSDHLAAFLRDLEALGRSRGYRADIRNRVRCLLKDCGWTYARDVSRDGFVSWRAKQSGKSPKTLNGYLDAISTMMQWLLRQGKVALNPLTGIERSEVRGREVFQRDAMSPDEFERLLRHAGGERRVLYLVAALTGLRRGALQRLTWDDVMLDHAEPHILVPAGINKNRHVHVAWLRDDLVAELRRIRSASRSSRVFAGILPPRGTAFLKADLKAAGIQRHGKSRIDFHSLRHTACTWGAATGEGGRVLRAFTGHKTESQLDRYTHLHRGAGRRVLDAMPRFDAALGGTQVGTQLGTLAGVNSGDGVSDAVAGVRSGGHSKTRKNTGKSRGLSDGVVAGQQDMSEYARQESNL